MSIAMVGTTIAPGGLSAYVEATMKEASKASMTKFHCLCMMEDGSEAYLSVRAYDEAGATEAIHDPEKGYKGVEYVLETLTPEEMERRKKSLRRSILGAVSL